MTISSTMSQNKKLHPLAVTLLLLVTTDASAQVFTCEEPSTRQREERIVGGTTAEPGTYPWQVALTGTFIGLCGGSLIGESWVLTAAHCVDESVNSQGEILPGVTVRVSRADIATGEIASESRLARRAFTKGGFDRHAPGLPNDVALIELTEPFALSRSDIPHLSTQKNDALFGSPSTCAVVTGWGTTDDGSLATNGSLRQAFVPIRSVEECRRSYPQRNIEAQHLCAGYDGGVADSCQGDSGGPLVVRGGPRGWIQVGIVSWGIGCGEPNRYGVYQRVAESIDWIETTISSAQ